MSVLVDKTRNMLLDNRLPSRFGPLRRLTATVSVDRIDKLAITLTVLTIDNDAENTSS